MRLRSLRRALAVLIVLVPAALVDARPASACSTKIYAYTAAMRSDLKNLATAQEAYYADHHRYVAQLSDLTGESPYNSSAGVTIVMTSGDSSAWSARATHSGIDQTCTIAYHTDPQATDGVPQCTPNPWIESANAAHRWRFAMFLASVVIAVAGLALGRGRPGAVTALIVLCVVNPVWMNPLSGIDCGTSTVNASTLWIGLGAALAFWSLTGDRRAVRKLAASGG